MVISLHYYNELDYQGNEARKRTIFWLGIVSVSIAALLAALVILGLSKISAYAQSLGYDPVSTLFSILIAPGAGLLIYSILFSLLDTKFWRESWVRTLLDLNIRFVSRSAA